MFTTDETFYVIRARHPNSEIEEWIRKSGRDGRGVWKRTSSFDYVEKMPTLARSKQALKSVGLKQMKNEGFALQILKVEASYQIQKIWPLSPLEALAQAAE